MNTPITRRQFIGQATLATTGALARGKPLVASHGEDHARPREHDD
jgi:hypothetical protein